MILCEIFSVWLFFFFFFLEFHFLIYLFIYLFLAVLGLRFCARAFSSCSKQGPLFIAVCGPLSRPLLLWSTGSRRAGSVVVAHGLSCSAACGIFPDQGSNLCPLHWQAYSQPLRHKGSPCLYSFAFTICPKILSVRFFFLNNYFLFFKFIYF